MENILREKARVACLTREPELTNNFIQGVRKVCPLVHIILRSVFAVTFNDVSIAKKQLLSIGVEPKIYHSRSEHTNDHPNDAVLVNNGKKTYFNINIPDMRIDKLSLIFTSVQYLVQ